MPLLVRGLEGGSVMFFSCKACPEKDRHIQLLEEQIILLKSQLAHSREREESAVDRLLNNKGMDAITPQAKMSMVDSDKATASLFSIFKDENDKDDGLIQEADNLSDERR